MQKSNAVVNAVIDGNVLTVDTFNDLVKYCNNTVISVKSKTGIYGKIHKLVVKNSKCSMTIDDIKRLLKNYKIFDELKEIEIITEDERFCTVDGMLYSKNKRRLYSCPRGKDGILVIPDGTDTITEDSCSSCNFSKIIIPDSVKQIGRYAFIRSYALEEVRGCKNVERICDYAFAYCKNLKKFSFGESIKSIGACAFVDTMLTEIYLPEGIYRVGRLAFNTIWVDDGIQTCVGPSQMYDIHIPSTLKHIGQYAFANAANVYTTFVNVALIHAGTGNGNLEHCHECNTWKLKIDGKPDVIVPKAIGSSPSAAKIANKINTVFGLIKDEKLQTDDSVITPRPEAGVVTRLKMNLRSPSCALRSGNEELSSELSPDAGGVSDSHARVPLPRHRRATEVDRGFPSVDKADNVISEAVTPPELYQYGSGSTVMTAALEQCRKYPNSSLKRFITKNISIIFYNLITSPTSRKGEEIMVSLIKDGVFTDTALKKLLEEIEQSDKKDSLITLKAYALDEIKHKNNTFKI